MNAKGPVFKYGDNIDTDVIIPARYLNTQSPAELAALQLAFTLISPQNQKPVTSQKTCTGLLSYIIGII